MRNDVVRGRRDQVRRRGAINPRGTAIRFAAPCDWSRAQRNVPHRSMRRDPRVRACVPRPATRVPRNPQHAPHPSPRRSTRSAMPHRRGVTRCAVGVDACRVGCHDSMVRATSPAEPATRSAHGTRLSAQAVTPSARSRAPIPELNAPIASPQARIAPVTASVPESHVPVTSVHTVPAPPSRVHRITGQADHIDAHGFRTGAWMHGMKTPERPEYAGGCSIEDTAFRMWIALPCGRI